MKDRINLYIQYLDMKKKKNSSPFKSISILILIASITVVILSFTLVKLENKRLLSKQNELTAYVTSEEKLRHYKTALSNKELIEGRQELLEKIQGVNGILLEKRQLNPDILEQISFSLPYGVQVESLNFSDGRATVNYESSNIHGPSLFARNLSTRPLIKSVDYQGFTKTERSLEEDVEEGPKLALDESMNLIIQEPETETVYTGIIELILEGGY